jgi:hypothetical protein
MNMMGVCGVDSAGFTIGTSGFGINTRVILQVV